MTIEQEPKGKLSVEERSQLMADYIDSYNIWLADIDEETRIESMQNMARIADKLGITEILEDDERR